MKYAVLVVRLLMGLMFVFFGSNAFLHFMQIPPLEGQAGAFIGALASNGYLQAIAVFQILGGLFLLLGGRFAALGLTLLGPVIVNIVLYHIFLEPKGMVMAAVVGVCGVFLLWAYREKFPAIFKL